jgi:hypothetical protein
MASEDVGKELRDKIELLLIQQHFELLEELRSPRFFGSWYKIWANANQEIRLLWDGMEHWLILQSRLSQEQQSDEDNWEDVIEQGISEDEDMRLIEEQFIQRLKELIHVT